MTSYLPLFLSFFICKPLAYLHLSHIHPTAGELTTQSSVLQNPKNLHPPTHCTQSTLLSLSLVSTVWGFGKHAYGNPFLFYILIFRSLLAWHCSKAAWCLGTSLGILTPRPSSPIPPPAKASFFVEHATSVFCSPFPVLYCVSALTVVVASWERSLLSQNFCHIAT